MLPSGWSAIPRQRRFLAMMEQLTHIARVGGPARNVRRYLAIGLREARLPHVPPRAAGMPVWARPTSRDGFPWLRLLLAEGLAVNVNAMRITD